MMESLGCRVEATSQTTTESTTVTSGRRRQRQTRLSRCDKSFSSKPTPSTSTKLRFASLTLPALVLATSLLLLTLHTTGSRSWETDAAAAAAAAAASDDSRSDAGDYDYSENSTDTSTVAPAPAPGSGGLNSTEEEGDSRASDEGSDDSDPPGWLKDAMNPKKPKALRANADSGVEKGTRTELPPVEIDTSAESRSDETVARLGVITHSDDPKTKAEPAPDSEEAEGSESAATTARPTKQLDPEDDEEGQGRSVLESLEKVLGPGSVSKGKAAKNGTAALNTTRVTSEYTSQAKEAIEKLNNATKLDPFELASKMKQNISSTIEQLGRKSERLSASRNTSIMINGRKFDQVESVECVDQQFYDILMKDLGLIMPDRKTDYYGTYFDPDYAKAIGSLIEAPAATNAKGIDASEGKLTVKDVIAEVRSLWNETLATYKMRRDQLDMTNLPLGRSGLPKSGSSRGNSTAGEPTTSSPRILTRITANFAAQPRHQAALANYRYLQERLEHLKLLLLSGEEALVIMNNKVRKLNRAVGETELAKALCSCITARSGRAAFSLMNELFVDKNSAKLLRKPEEAKRRGDEAAVDTAEFCAYWYGDTIRSEAMQKEKQIKRLVLAVAKERERELQLNKKLNRTQTIKETKTIHKADGSVLKETRTRVVTSIIEMTDLWMPKLAQWIRTTLKLGDSNPEKTLAQISTGNLNVSSTTTNKTSYVVSATTKVPSGKLIHANPNALRRRRETDDNGFSTPFDNEGTYADIDDPIQLASSALMQQKALASYPILTGSELRRKRAAPAARKNKTSTAKPAAKKAPVAKTTRPNKRVTKKQSNNSTKIDQTIRDLRKKGNLVPTGPSQRPVMIAKPVITTTAKPSSTSTRAPAPKKEPSFETRISDSSTKCAVDGFSALLDIAHDQNSLMYETADIPKDDPYIRAFGDTFKEVFEKRWREKRDSWSKSLSDNEKADDGASAGRSVDEEISDSFEAHGGAYERGARLGFTVGKFVGDKSANQWPDPSELNTFSYDSLFLAGIGHDYSEEDSKALERRIVAEAAKRVAFSEANRVAFAKTLHSSYLNGVFIVPVWGVLHAQRAVAKQAAKEGGRAGFDAASKAAADFMPRANKFFQMHRQQRLLAAPYKKPMRLSDKYAGLSEEISEVQFETELNRNISSAAIECGQKSGTLMGAVMGLVVAPEAFETYTRFRGSLEALESEFYQFKLGAMRAYELGETWALLNYTATMNQNLQLMKTKMGSHPTSLPESARKQITTQAPTETSIKANLTSSFAKKAEREESVSLFESKTGHPDQKGDANQMAGEKNTNNIFQFMITNYGTHLVANHSRKHMLKIRNMFIDENLLRDMKVQSGDLIANPEQAALGLSSMNASTSETSIDDSDPFEPGPYAGELRGEFNSLKDEERKRPIKFDILDLGPVLEFADEMKKPVPGSNKTTLNANQTLLEETPLTDDLGKVGKLFLKMSVARRKKARQLNGPDEVAAYLNGGNKFDQGDGYMSGTFSAIVTHLANDTRDESSQPMVQDDFSMESQILDELFERIEKTPADMGSVGMVENIMQVTTMAPKKVEAIKEKKANATATTMKPFKSTTMQPAMIISRNATGSNKPTSAPTQTSTTALPGKKSATTTTTTARPSDDGDESSGAEKSDDSSDNGDE